MLNRESGQCLSCPSNREADETGIIPLKICLIDYIVRGQTFGKVLVEVEAKPVDLP